jgi:hypothetical protein
MGIVRKLYVCSIALFVIVIFLVIGCASGSGHKTSTVTTDQTATTTATVQPIVTTPTTQTSTPVTKDTTVITNGEPTDYQVLDLIVPEGEVEGLWNITVIVTNSTNNNVSCDIPIKLYRVEDPVNFTTFTIQAALATDETKEVIYENIYVPDGSYEVEVSGIIKSVEVG